MKLKLDNEILHLNSPFNITFRWQDEALQITLADGKDILKLGKICSKILSDNGIEHTIESVDAYKLGAGGEVDKGKNIDSNEPDAYELDKSGKWWYPDSV